MFIATNVMTLTTGWAIVVYTWCMHEYSDYLRSNSLTNVYTVTVMCNLWNYILSIRRNPPPPLLQINFCALLFQFIFIIDRICLNCIRLDQVAIVHELRSNALINLLYSYSLIHSFHHHFVFMKSILMYVLCTVQYWNAKP